MNRNQLIVISFLVSMFVAALARAAEPPMLTLGETVKRTLTGGESHEYRVKLKENQYLLLTANQLSINVVLRFYGPDGGQIEEVGNSRWTDSGPESVSFFSKAKGDYRIEIAPFDENAGPGEYAVEIIRLEKAGRTPARKVDQLLALVDRPDSPGAAVAVIQDGKTIYKKGFGSAQLEYGIPITPSTIFHVASVSKQFTAFAVAVLADQGKLSLDDDVRKHIPEVPDFGKTITLRHLIYHTSGLRDQWHLLYLAGWQPDDVMTLEHILTIVRNQKELNFDPGEERAYCNTGYTLLAETVARVTGQSFREWTQANIFEPLKMNNTHFHDDHEHLVPNRAYSYFPHAEASSGFRKGVLNFANVGATSLFTTVEDLAKWSNNFDTAHVGGLSVIKTMLESGGLNDDGQEWSTPAAYAFGLFLGEYRGLTNISHSGGDAGFRSMLNRFPEQHFAVVILSNFANFEPFDVSFAVAELYLEAEMIAAVPGGRMQQIQLTADSADEGEEPNNQLIEIAPVESPEMTPEKLAEYQGRYDSSELGTFYSLGVQNGKLVARHRRHGEIELKSTGADQFSSNRWFFERLRFERDTQGEIITMLVTTAGSFARHVRFQRQLP